MMLSQKDLEQIEDFAYNLTPISDIALLLNIDKRLLLEGIADDSSDIYKAYYTGKAKIQLEIRKNEITLAQAGSPQAMQLVDGYLSKMNSEE